MSDNIADKLQDAATGDDTPMGKEHPAAPAAFVMMAYPLLLIVGILAAFALFAFSGS